MAALVWFVAGISLWHFTVWVPDRFWGGIVGAFLGSIAGAMATGAIFVLVAVPGALIGLAAIYAIGARSEAGLARD